MYFSYNEPTLIGKVARAAFPSNRKDFSVDTFKGATIANSYWSGGSRTSYILVALDSLQSWGVPTSHPFFDRKDNGERCGRLEINELPPNTALVTGGIFMGKPAPVTVSLSPENIASLLPAPVELTEAESMAISLCNGVKSGYRQDEFTRHGLGDYGPKNPTIARLTDRGFLKINRAGAVSVTLAGKNAG